MVERLSHKTASPMAQLCRYINSGRVACSNKSALPAVLGDCGLYFDPDEIGPPVRSHYVPRAIKSSDGNEYFQPTSEPNIVTKPSKTDSMSGGGR